ncbi:sugar transport protein 5 [Magnolia sinica]|uniref:sugar transport protein 5 n=1 Tax=Magnolia sinica TaxID=86752 RepID=UPI00265A1160|nr:sugar transport protein 5 [Magnolia sinica]
MAGGGFAVNGDVKDFNGGRMTASVVITCIVAASGGLIFGYDIGISGGVTTMESFLKRFFPSVLRKMSNAKQNEYCVFDSQVLTSFTSSLYIAGLLASLAASRVTKALGRQAIMLLGGATFLIGSAINAAAVNVVMLILGRILLGFGVGFTNQATPLYISEVAPPKWRGGFNTAFQFFIGIGVVVANVINYLTSRIHGWGWRLSLGLAAMPAALMTIGTLLIPDTPTSLIQRGKIEQARLALQRAHGPNTDIESKLADLVAADELSRSVKEYPYKIILRRQYRPHLVMSVAIPLFQQMTGINIIAFYAPILFQTVGFGSNSALMAAIILGLVNLGSILVSTFVVDRFGRRFLFMQGGAQMIICQVAVACVLGAKIGASGEGTLSKAYSGAVLMLMCIYAAGFGWSWGPLSWLIPSEIFPMEIRSAGQSISVAVNFAVTFVLAQTFLAMLCHFKYASFLFYAGWILVMTLFIAFFLPETKGVPLESMHSVWKEHWYWSRFVREGKPTCMP